MRLSFLMTKYSVKGGTQSNTTEILSSTSTFYETCSNVVHLCNYILHCYVTYKYQHPDIKDLENGPKMNQWSYLYSKDI